MRDIDLIPADYLLVRRMRRQLALFAAALALMLLGVAAGRAWIGTRIAAERVALEQARRSDGAASQQRARLAALQATKAVGDAQLATLHALLDASTSETLWQAVDDAYNDRIWLDTLSYSRTVRADGAVPPVAATLAAAPVVAASGVPVLEHDVELRGQALDHGGLTEFMRALAERPGIATVRLGDSGLKPFAAIEVIGFTVTATLGPRQGALR